MKFLFAQFQNQFVSGGLLLLLTGSLIALAREMPRRIWAWLRHRVTISIEIYERDPLFAYVTAWLAEQPYSRRARSLIATTIGNRADGQEEVKNTSVLFSPAHGIHVFFYDGRLIWLTRSKDDKPVGGVAPTDSSTSGFPARESYSISVLGGSQEIGRRLIEEIVRFGTRPTGAIRLYHSTFGWWQSSQQITPRRIESVILPTDHAESVLADVRAFLGDEAFYREVGIPWHRGYLLHGLPGTGKTSLVVALAGELRMNLYLLNVSGVGMNDERLSSLMSEVRSGSIVLMEDVDCTFPERRGSDKQRVTLSGLLNCLDGVSSREGCLIFMTTNCRDKLDPALTRPGRVDFFLEFGPATDEQLSRLASRIAPDIPRSALTGLRGGTMAEAQQFLLGKRQSATDIASARARTTASTDDGSRDKR